MTEEHSRFDRVARIDIKVAPYEWTFLRSHAAEIEAHWQDLCTKKPRIFDGRVLMMHDCHIVEDGGEPVLTGFAFETGYKGFIARRDFGAPGPKVLNCFAMAALRSADGAFMLGRMGQHTASAGQLYFAAGTPDRDDILDGQVDFEGSALRELAEETGIAAHEVTLASHWTLVRHGAMIACMRPAQSALSSAELMAKCAAFIAKDPEPELDGLVPMFSMADTIGTRIPAFMLDYLRHSL